MRTAVNGGLLFLNAKWHGEATEYGFEFLTPSAIGRFIDVFCTHGSPWYFKIEDGPLRVYAMGLYSTYDEQAQRYAGDARDAAKFGGGTASFWKQFLFSRLYLSGLCAEFDYIATYPGHSTNAREATAQEELITLAKCFRKFYLPDLIVRHTTAIKSQKARNQREAIDHKNQVDTIRLTENPLKNDSGKRFAASPLRQDKTVLVLDDICTRGFSFEAARHFIQQTGASVISVAWLKTPNTPYTRLDLQRKFDPFKAQTAPEQLATKTYAYGNHIDDVCAPRTIADSLAAYKKWDWPANLR